MSINLYKKCIKELLKNESNDKKNIEPIYQYLKSLKVFLYLIKNQNTLDIDYIFKELSKIIKLKKVSKNELIFQQGEIVDNFYIILNGHLKKLKLKQYEYFMSEEEYLLFLLQLRMNNQIEIIKQSIYYNSIIFSFPYDNFDHFVKDLSSKSTKGGIYLDSEIVIEKAKEVDSFINEQKNLFNKINLIKNLSPEEYIKINKVSDEVVNNTILINNFRNKSLNEKNEEEMNKIKLMIENKKKVIIPSYEIFSEIKTGSTFGEEGLENNNKQQDFSIISIEDESYLGYINKNDYDLLIHEAIDKRKKNIFNSLFHFAIFRTVSQSFFEKKYLKFIKDKIFDINNNLFTEGEENDEMYFIAEGEYELCVNKNIIEVNEMIVNYKKILKKIIGGNEINNKNLNLNEEIKQNNRLLANKKIRSEEGNKLIFDKKYIKLNIIYKNDIIGLNDVYLFDPENEKEYKNFENSLYNMEFSKHEKLVKRKCLLTCKCLTYNCHTYCLSNHIFSNFYYNEGTNLVIKDLEIKKIYSIIERLQKHKEFILDLVKKDKNKLSETLKKVKYFTRNPKFYQSIKLEPTIFQNIMTGIKTISDEKGKQYINKNIDISKKQHNQYQTINNRNIKNVVNYDLTDKLSKSTDRKSKYNLINSRNRKINDIGKNDTIYTLYNKNYNNISNNNMSKFLINDFLYENFFYNYTFNNIKNLKSSHNKIEDNIYKLTNQRISNSHKNTNLKDLQNKSKDILKTLDINKKMRIINIKKGNNNLMYYDKILYNININIDNNNNKSKNNSKLFSNNKFIDLSNEEKNLDESNKTKSLNKIPKTDIKKINLNRINPIKIYDPLAFDKFNNIYKLNFKMNYQKA